MPEPLKCTVSTPEELQTVLPVAHESLRAPVEQLQIAGLSIWQIFSLILQYGPTLAANLKAILDSFKNGTPLPPAV